MTLYLSTGFLNPHSKEFMQGEKWIKCSVLLLTKELVSAKSREEPALRAGKPHIFNFLFHHS